MSRVLLRVFLNCLRLFFLRRRKEIGKKCMLSFATELSFARSSHVTIGEKAYSDGVCRFVASKNARLEIGDNCYFNMNCFVGARQKIIIGNHCNFGPGVTIIDNNHKFEKNKGISSNQYNDGEVIIGNECWFGANAVVLKDSHIGDGCVIGAGCIVKGDIPANSIVTNHQDLHVRQIEER